MRKIAAILDPPHLPLHTAAGGRYSLRIGSEPQLARQREEDRAAIPVIDKSKHEDRTFSREDFTFDRTRDTYTCPAGKGLTTTGKIMNDDLLLYRRASSIAMCVRSRCDAARRNRRARCSIHEDARDVVPRPQTHRVLFAHLKRILRLARLHCAGHSGRKTSSPWRPSPKTCAGSPSWRRDHRRRPQGASRKRLVCSEGASKPPFPHGTAAPPAVDFSVTS